MPIKVLDMFCGMSAFRTAAEQIGGFSFVGYCDNDPTAVAAYRTLYKTEGEYFCNDARAVNTDEIPDFDLLVGGFPCVAFSAAGARKAFDDPRGTLFFELSRILAAKHPAYFVFENVPPIRTICEGRVFTAILSELSRLGYLCEWQCIDGAAYLPQSRKRVFLVGYLGDRCPAKILAFGGNDEENCEKGKPEQLIGGSQSSRVYSTNGTAVTQCSGSGGMGGKTGLYFIDYNSPPNLTDTARCITARQDSGVSNHKGEHSAVFVDDAPRAIINPFKEHTRQNGRRIKNPNEPMFTITVTDRHGIVHRGRIRRLMPVECWKLQGFTKEQFEKVAATGMSDAQLYKQAGNSITVAVVEAIARNLLKFDKEINDGKHNKNF